MLKSSDVELKTTINTWKIPIPLTRDELHLIPTSSEISSPKFIVIDKRTNVENTTEWFMSANLKYPKAPDHIGLYLWHVFENLTIDFEVKCTFSLIDCNGHQRNHFRFKRIGSSKPHRDNVGLQIISHNELFENKSTLLTDQFLTIRCELEIVNLGYFSSSLSKLN